MYPEIHDTTIDMKQFRRSVSLALALVLLLGMVYITPITSSADSLFVTSYAANLSVKTTEVTNLVSSPNSGATAKYTLPVDTMLTVKALHQNGSGYWYEVLYYDLTLYIDATATTMVDHLTGDVTVTGLMSPASLGIDQGFPIGGTITSSLNKLGTVTAAMHYRSSITTEPAISSTDTINGYSYTMDGSALDSKLIVSDLAAGDYTYLLTVEAISYYIDDNGDLATSTKTVVLENKPCIITDRYNPNPVTAKGIDVSTWQVNVNWAQVATQVDFAVFRISYGTRYVDTEYYENVSGCTANGVPFGVYIYSLAKTVAEARAEAEYVLDLLNGIELDLPVYFDFEDSSQVSLSASTKLAIVKEFCETVKAAGYEPGLYASLSWFNDYFVGSYYDTLPKWVAQLNSSCTYTKGVRMWQYSWTGSFTGISGDVDCNYYYGEFPGKSTDTSYLASCTYYPSNLDVTVASAVNMRQYPSTGYSITEELAAGTELHVTGLYKNTSGELWYQVDRGGVTGYVHSGYVTVTNYRYDDLSVVDPTMADLALNSGYFLKGRLRSVYNNMYKVNAKVYKNEDTLATPVLTSSATPNAKSYKLNYSDVCDNLIFSDLETGYYTYEISADVKNYYVSDGVLANTTENVVVWTAPFTVGDATIESDATVCNHVVVTDKAVAATCTAPGLTEGSHCSVCGAVFAAQTEIPALGHRYTSITNPATCLDYEKIVYNCGNCGDSYSIYAYELTSQWSETKPEGIDESLLETKTQYRYSDYEVITSNVADLADHTLLSKEWEEAASGTNNYVSSWTTGFDTTSSMYAAYNNVKLTASETATDKTVVHSDEQIGYIYWHWCMGTYAYGPINRTTSTTQNDTHTTFHAYFDTTDPSGLTTASDGSVVHGNADCCTDSYWFYNIPVYAQTYTTYEALFTYEHWTDYSDWSDTAVSASATRKVQTRTLYRYTGAELGEHNVVGGVCTVCGQSDVCRHPSHNVNGICASCGETVAHSYTDGACSVCGKAQAVPVITPKAPSLSFEGEIYYNVYFVVENMDDAVEMGLITFGTYKSDVTVDTADYVVPGYEYDTGRQMYRVRSNGIAAKNLGDTLYFRVYAKLSDGSYVYSNTYNYSAKTYALDRLANSTNEEMKALCVAMLNYGAAAQTHFSYKPYSLMNASLTTQQKALVKTYHSGMVAAVSGVNSSKVGSFAYNSAGWSGRAPSVSFEGAFGINYYFTPSKRVDGNMTLYYWNVADYNSASVLTPANATGSVVMTATGSGAYLGSVANIAAKEIDQTIFVAGVYTSGGVSYATGVLPYSLGAYCADRVANGSETMQPLAAATVVYGYYAKQYFTD